MKRSFISTAAMLALTAWWAAPATAVPIPGLFHTGVNNAGANLPFGSVDPHWVLNLAPGTFGPNAFVMNPRPGSWVPNTANSQWIGPVTNGLTSLPGGTYRYTHTFDLTGFDETTAIISGQWSSDNQSSILLNGLPTGNIHAGGSGAFLTFDSFIVAAGFVPGINTLTVQVNNISGPHGAHVTAIQSDVQVPEPAAIGLFSIGGLALLKRGKRS